MIVSHDSFTFAKPRFAIMSLVAWLWRTQDKNLAQQYNSGVRMLDIRVRRQGDKWRVCHGFVDLRQTFDSLGQLVATLEPWFKIRIILERGDDSKFREECEKIKSNPNVRFLCVKRGWKIIKDVTVPGWDYSYLPWKSDLTFWENLRRYKFDTIKRHARRVNPPITQSMMDAPNTHYFDYI